MPRYYNKTRGPLSVQLRDGSSTLLPPKRWSSDISSSQEGSTSLVRLLQKGLVARETVAAVAAPAPVLVKPVQKPVQKPVPKLKPTPKPESVPESMSQPKNETEVDEDTAEKPVPVKAGAASGESAGNLLKGKTSSRGRK